MELRPGYKQTELGVIPEVWDVVPISTLLEKGASITYGVVQPGRNDPGGVLFVRGGDIFDGAIDVEGLRRISASVSLQHQRTIVRGGEILISLVGFPGESAIVPDDLAGANIARQVALVRLNSEINSCREFICHYLRSSSGKRWLLKEAFGSAQQVINLKDVNRLELPLPRSSMEQSAIANALGDVDALLAAQDALITKKRAIKQGAMQELLTGERRLPGFSGKWEVKRLGNFGACHRGVSYDPGNDLYQADSQESVRLLRANNVQDSTIDLDELQFVNNARVSEHQYLRGDDVLICMANGSKNLVGKAARFVLSDDVSYTFGAFMGCFRPDPIKISPAFAFYLFQTEAYRLHLANLLAGSSINNLSPKSIEGLEIKIPMQIEEQSSIAEVLTDMDSELTALEFRRAKTTQLKQGMMQALLTGWIRLI